jgi:hypothetical protein
VGGLFTLAEGLGRAGAGLVAATVAANEGNCSEVTFACGNTVPVSAAYENS